MNKTLIKKLKENIPKMPVYQNNPLVFHTPFSPDPLFSKVKTSASGNQP